MKRFKFFFLFVSGSLFAFFLILQQLIVPSLQTFVMGIAVFVFYLFLASLFLHQWSRPLEQIMDTFIPCRDGRIPQPIVEDWGRKNAFSEFILSLNSLTERMHMHMQLSQDKDKEMEGILDSLNEGVIVFNVRSNVIFVNQMACKMFDVSRESLIGRSLSCYGGQRSLLQKCHEIVLHALQSSETRTGKWTSEKLYLDLVASPLMHQAGVILVIQDKTSDYKMLEVGKTFVANASHELRTPITIVRGFAEMLQNVLELSPETMIDITAKIVRTCDRLDKLVKSLLTIADLEHFSLDRFRLCSVKSLIENCHHLLSIAYPQVRCRVSCDENLFVLGDFDLLDLAIMNLLENGVKYSSSSSEIRLDVGHKERFVTISVRDEGIGIPSSDLPYIFDRFYTVDKARSRKSGGAGLGLSIVKTIVEKHLGSVSVISEYGQGTTFTITLPVV
jgi:two-component system phosphate regulon sensor histidine kinase PhoR